MTVVKAAWPFFMAATRASGYRLVLAPDFMLDHGDALGALRASPEHLEGTASRTALREVDSAEGLFCIVYRASGARMRDFGLGGDEPVTDHAGRGIDFFEGLVLWGGTEECARLTIGTADLDHVRDLARKHYQEFWGQHGSFRTYGSKPFPVSGRGLKVQPTVLSPWREPAPLPVDREPIRLLPVQQPDANRERKLPRLTRGVAIGIAAAMACAAAGGFIWSRQGTPPVLPPTGLRASRTEQTSVELDWARLLTGPHPDQYRIVLKSNRNETKVFHVPGTSNSYKVTGLTPATNYTFRMSAIQDGISSPESAAVRASTVTPLPTQGLLTGTWPVQYVVTEASSDQKIFTRGLTSIVSWNMTPSCASGACPEVTLSGAISRTLRFALPLRLSQGTYLGSANGQIEVCPGYADYPILTRTTLDFEIRATRAGLDAGQWSVTAWSGNVRISVSHKKYHDAYGVTHTCPGGTIQFSVAGH
jgi:hypothetical protein